MSGGSMQYLYSRIENDATFATNTPLRKAFKKHLALVCKALHDIEWVDSCDYSEGDEDAAIRKCLAKDAVLASAIEDVHAAIAEFHKEIERMQAVNK